MASLPYYHNMPPNEKLLYAARDGDMDYVKSALADGADINYRDLGGDTPLMAAARNGCQTVVMHLISKGADLNFQDSYGNTALILAAWYGHDAIVTDLLSAGADSSITASGRTALNWAKRSGHVSVINILQSHTARQQYSGLLDKALEEGQVSVKWSKFSLSGPPGSGKSSVMKLLLNEEPPLEHDSTPVATDPHVRHMSAMARSSKWERSNYDSMKTMVAQEIKDFKTSLDPPTKAEKSRSATPSVPIMTRLKQILGLTEKRQPHPLSPSKAAEDIVQHLTSLDISGQARKERQDSPALGQVHWIYGVDSGGQAAFLDIAPALLRYNCVNLLTHKMDESFSDKPQFLFSIHGEQVGEPIQRQITHLQLLQASIRALASITPSNVEHIQLTDASNPMFVVLGTFLDKIGRESLGEKNKILWSHFEQYVRSNILKCYREESNTIIYPVNTTDRGEVTCTLAEEIRATIRDRYIEASIPARWFLFQLELDHYQKEHSNTSIVSVSECERIGRSIKMNREDVKAALLYYSDLTIFLYFPSVLPQVVFLHPQPLFNKLSELISISFVDTVEHLRKLKVSIPDGSHRNLKTQGTFDMKLLQSLSSGFTPDFTPADFISLMEFLFVIASLPEEGKYFLPSVLPTCDSSQLEELRKSYVCRAKCDPLVLTWEMNVIPQGLFPALVVNLLKSEQEFKLVQQSQPFRNAIELFSIRLGVQLLLVDAIHWLEVYCTGPQERCPTVRNLIHRGIGFIVTKFKYIHSNPHDSFLHTVTGHICYPDKRKEVIVCTGGCCIVPIDKQRQLCWFNDTSYSIAPDHRDLVMLLADISHLWYELGTLMNIRDDLLQGLMQDNCENSRRLIKVLEIWRDNPQVPYTWESIIDAVGSPVIGKGKKVKELNDYLKKF